MRFIDISQEVLSCNVFPGDDSPKGELVRSMEEGELYNLSMLSMCAHNGTHIDAPFHFINEGKTVDKMPLEAFVGDCYVARHEGDVTAENAREILKKAKAAVERTIEAHSELGLMMALVEALGDSFMKEREKQNENTES